MFASGLYDFRLFWGAGRSRMLGSNDMNTERKLRQSELNTKRVARCDEKNYDKVMVRLPKGTVERIKELGLVPATFIKETTLTKLDEIEAQTDREI